MPRRKSTPIQGVPGGVTIYPPDEMFINEQALYALFISSKKPEFVKFQDWVFGEVLPTLRRTGAYVVPTAETNQPNLNELQPSTEL